MKKSKKLLSVLTIFTLIFTQFTVFTYAVADEQAPEVSNISSTSNDDGTVITWTCQITDDESGPSQIAIFWESEEDTSKTLNNQWSITANDTEYYDLEYTVPENAVPGYYRATSVIVTDNNNHTRTYEDPDVIPCSGFRFEAPDQSIDHTGPTISNLTVTSANVTAPSGSFTVTVDITDDSGIDGNTVGLNYAATGNLSSSSAVNPSSVSGDVYTFTIPAVQNKQWQIVEVYATDIVGNSTVYSPENTITLTPSNYTNDTTPPTISNITYNKTSFTLPDNLEIRLDYNDGTNMMPSYNFGVACFKAVDTKVKGNKYYSLVYGGGLAEGELENDPNYDGPFVFGTVLQQATGGSGTMIPNKAAIKVDFNADWKYTGEFYLDKIYVKDSSGNQACYSVEAGTLQKQIITIHSLDEQYDLITSATKPGYIDEIKNMPADSKVLCNVVKENQVIKKELFDAIKGKDITVTFMNIYSGTGESYGGESVSSADSSMGVQWIINGKDIVNETKDVNMEIVFTRKEYSKLIVPEYEFDWEKEMEEEMALWNDDEDEEAILAKLRALRKSRINKYFDFLKEQGYKDTEKYREKALALVEEDIPAATEDYIMMADEEGITHYIEMKFKDNGVLPCKTIVRFKSTYALRNLPGADKFKLYFADGSDITLEDKDIECDEEDYINLSLTHNSTFMLTSDDIETLEKETKTDEPTEEEKKEETISPKTGDNIALYVAGLLLSIAGAVIVYKKK